ncbi:hypothetical protein EPH95_06655 [Salicibibacter halophilus]|uniref:Uncharacterized protein n=1 Tax=Salicibibacter halophilus TaxID=2502791 RepID=A0A514LGC3_9BACI|nr:hypothetical protein [Salicibibacter halophilus]QDI90898.1 hypothetical protein EPH95_06655 [Salicibibacter halophilus]
MYKKVLPALMLAIVFVMASFGFSSTASAHIDPPFSSEFDFTTGDGVWDGTIQNSNTFNATINVDVPGDATNLQARLCSSNGNCTEYKGFDEYVGDHNYFYYLAPGTYYGDIVSTSGSEVSGTVTYNKW